MFSIPLMKEDDDANQEIGVDEPEDIGESILSSTIDEDNLDHHLKVLHLG